MADIRVTFTKLGTLQYISHLDLQRAVARMLIRSQLPLGYTEGFNPHPRLNIALPLSIYQEGERELFDFRVTDDIPVEVIAEKLKSVAFPGMDIVNVEVALSKPKTKTAIWRLEFETSMDVNEFAKAFSSEMLVVKRSKSGEKTVDIAPMIKLISAEPYEKGIIAHAELNAANSDYLNPAYIAAFFGDKVELKRTVRENILF